MLKSIFKKREEKDEDGEIIIKVSEDEFKASIFIKGPKANGYEPDINDAHDAITKKGVVFGIDQNLLMRIFESKAFDREFVFAKGKQFIQTKQAKIKYFFKTNPDMKPIEDKKGNLDYKNVKLIQTVREGAKLCEFIPAEKGTPGKTVTGKAVQPEDLKDIKLPSGVNVFNDPENQNILLASVDGTVRKSGDVIEVTKVLNIKGDVDFSTGNIESIISTKISGDIKSTFMVKVEKDLEVVGTIEDADVYAGGKIFVKSGIIGKANGKVAADDSISARSCHKMTINSKKDVMIKERITDSTIIADGKIKINSKNSDILRCKLLAKDGVIVRRIGNDNYEPVEVIVGMPGELYLESETLKIRIIQLQKSVDRIGKDLKLAHKMKAFKGGSNKKTIAKLQQDYSESMRKLGELKEKKNDIDSKIDAKKNPDASLIVFEKIFPRVTLNICGKKLIISEEKAMVEFKYGEEDVIVVNLKEKYDRFEIQQMMLKS